MNSSILRTEIRAEYDIVLARQRARQIASLLGLDAQSQSRVATAVSEIARNAWQYAGGGKVVFELAEAPARSLRIVVSDGGPGIPNLSEVLGGKYRSPSGLGLGLVGAKRLSDTFEIHAETGSGTTVVLGKLLPPRSRLSPHEDVADLTRRLAQLRHEDVLAESRAQNQELLQLLAESRDGQAEVERLNQELAETNRGVLALYAELDERALDLARVSELKSRFLSNISHELRTPLNAILNISRLLLDHSDGPLTDEQDRQVHFIRGAAASLSDMVNDLLDLARIEAGRTIIRPTEFTATDLFSALRGMFRPLATSEAVALIFDEPLDIPPLTTDEGKLSQILRNFISNALKFTERGEVRISTSVRDGGWVCFTVADTGIGIALEDQERVFEEFTQIDGELQHRTKGTGLGLPLSRKLAELLGGSVHLASTTGGGSSFSVTIPIQYVPARQSPYPGEPAREAEHV